MSMKLSRGTTRILEAECIAFDAADGESGRALNQKAGKGRGERKGTVQHKTSVSQDSGLPWKLLQRTICLKPKDGKVSGEGRDGRDHSFYLVLKKELEIYMPSGALRYPQKIPQCLGSPGERGGRRKAEALEGQREAGREEALVVPT